MAFDVQPRGSPTPSQFYQNTVDGDNDDRPSLFSFRRRRSRSSLLSIRTAVEFVFGMRRVITGRRGGATIAAISEFVMHRQVKNPAESPC